MAKLDTLHYSEDLERAVIGYLLMSPDSMNNGLQLDQGLFYLKDHQIVYKAMLDLNKRGIVPSIAQTAALLDEQGELETPGYFLTGLREDASFDVKQDTRKLCELAYKRGATEEAHQVLNGKIEIPADLEIKTDFQRTDAGQAEYFAAQYRDTLRFDHKRGRWLLFRKSWWQEDVDREVIRMVKVAARKRYKEAVSIENLEERGKESKFTIGAENRAKIEAVLALAKAEKPIADAGESWDADPFLLGVQNGVVDLSTGELKEGRAEDRISRHVPINFISGAPCDRWRKFLTEIMQGNNVLVDYLHRAIGYSLTGDTQEQCLFILWGKGANGKTVLLNILRYILGPYAWNANFSLLEWNRQKTSTDDLANIEGRRLVVSSETSDSRRLNEARIKALTGGDSITARHLYQSEREFTPMAKFWLATNHLPVVGDDSDGFWRRVHLIPFTATFTGANEDRGLENTLKSEAPGIIAWAVDGCHAWQEKGLQPPDAVKAATEQYRQDSDPLADFISECCNEDAEVRAGQLYLAYSNWTEQQGMKRSEILSQAKFGRLMAGRFESTKTSRGKSYLGVSLRFDPTTGV
ncbi:phage/plasmid primase, P4 family [Candidatus Neomarinimicrobiota bacterium]